MAKSQLRIKARLMRRQGKSIRDIEKILGVSRSSASLWCQDIELTPKQINFLHKKMVIGSYKGRMIGAQLQREKKQKIVRDYRETGIKELNKFSDQDLFFLGLGLYIGEGNKRGNHLQFTNSSPEVIKLFILWLERIFKINREDMYFSLLINKIYKKDVEKKIKEWSKILGVRLDQFRKTVLIKAKNKKVYENSDKYLGTLVIRVKKSSNLLYRVLGLIYGLMYNLEKQNDRVAQPVRALPS